MLGLDSRSLLLSGYEGVPYSFVLDWVVDVGSWMRAALPDPEVQDLGLSLGLHRKVESTTAVEFISATQTPSTDYPLVPSSSVCSVSLETYQRNTSVPIPALPPVNFDLERLTRRIDGLSLAWQRATTHLPRR